MLRRARVDPVVSIPRWYSILLVFTTTLALCTAVFAGLTIRQQHFTDNDISDLYLRAHRTSSDLFSTIVQFNSILNFTAANSTASLLAVQSDLQQQVIELQQRVTVLESTTFNLTQDLVTTQWSLNATKTSLSYYVNLIFGRINEVTDTLNHTLSSQIDTLNLTLSSQTNTVNRTLSSRIEDLRVTGLSTYMILQITRQELTNSTNELATAIASVNASVAQNTRDILWLNATRHNFTSPAYFHAGLYYRGTPSFKSYNAGAYLSGIDMSLADTVTAVWPSTFIKPVSGGFREIGRPSLTLSNWTLSAGVCSLNAPMGFSCSSVSDALQVRSLTNEAVTVPAEGACSMTYLAWADTSQSPYVLNVSVSQACHPQGDAPVLLRQITSANSYYQFTDSFYAYPCKLKVIYSQLSTATIFQINYMVVSQSV